MSDSSYLEITPVVIAWAIASALIVGAGAAVGGAMMAIGALGLLFVTIQPVRAWCGDHGSGGTSSGGFFAPQARTSGGSVTADGVSTGYIDEGIRRAVYRCQDGKLVDFHYE